jgi:hypothetical protein
MVSVLVSSVADPVFRPHLINSKTIKAKKKLIVSFSGTATCVF